MIQKYSFSFCRLSFHFLASQYPLKHQRFNFDNILFMYIFSFFSCAFSVVSKKPVPNQKSQRFTSKSFIILALLFRYLIYLELIFVYGVSQGSKFILLHVTIQLSQHHLLKRVFFPPQGSQHPCQKSVGHKYTQLLLCSEFQSLNYISILMPLPHNLDCFCFAVVLNSGSVSLSTLFFFFFFFQDDFGYSRSLIFLYKFQDQQVNFCNESSGDFDRDYIESGDQFED